MQPKINKGFAIRKTIGHWVSIITLVLILGLGIWAIVSARTTIAERDKLIETGHRVEGIATGRFNTYEKKLSKYSRGPIYHAYYTFTKLDGTQSSTYGDKEYRSSDDIKKGMKATIYYSDNPGGDTAVTDEQ